MHLTLRQARLSHVNATYYDPKTLLYRGRDIWILQQRLPKRFGRRAFQLLTHPKFRAGYDFLLARGQIEGGDLLELAQWWTHFQHADNGKQKGVLNALRKSEGGAKGARVSASVNQRSEVLMHKEHVYIGVGSNLAIPGKARAFDAIGQIEDTRVLKSSLYSGKPMGPQDQPDYINAVCLIETSLKPTAY